MFPLKPYLNHKLNGSWPEVDENISKRPSKIKVSRNHSKVFSNYIIVIMLNIAYSKEHFNAIWFNISFKTLLPNECVRGLKHRFGNGLELFLDINKKWN